MTKNGHHILACKSDEDLIKLFTKHTLHTFSIDRYKTQALISKNLQ